MGFAQKRNSINELKDPNECGIEIPPEVTALIEKFDPEIKIKIKIIPAIYAQALDVTPPVIALSKRFFEKRIDNIENFTTEDIKVLVAHELGHIIHPKSSSLKNHFEYLVKAIGLGLIVLFAIIYLLEWWLEFLPCFILTTTFLLLWFGRSWFIALSHDNENRADSFAIVEAPISLESFAQCFSKVDFVKRQELALGTRLEFVKVSLTKLILNTHPSVEQRIWRVYTLYGMTKSPPS
jgi:hypothetical protein